jgi:DNA-binding beta-propeller fold protein YncE
VSRGALAAVTVVLAAVAAVTALAFGLRGRAGRSLLVPLSVAVASDGTVYAGDLDRGDIVQIARPDRILKVIGPRLSAGLELRDPFGIAIGSNGTMFVGDGRGDRVLALRGGRARDITPTGALHPVFPQGIALGPDGRLYIADMGRCRIVVARPSGGTALRAIGTCGSGAGALVRPAAIAVRGKELYVGQHHSFVQVYGLDGRWRRRIGAGIVSDSVGVSVTPDGRVLVADEDARCAWEFGPSGRLLRRFDHGTPSPKAIAAVPGGDIVVAHFRGPALLWFNAAGVPVERRAHLHSALPHTFGG